MKNIWKISTIVLIILFSIIFFRENYPTRIYNRLFTTTKPTTIHYPPRYYGVKSQLEILNNNKNKIIFLGDSITEECRWDELFGREDIVNRGIGWDTTQGVLDRVDFYLSQKPKCIFLMIGINDIGVNVVSNETIINNYSSIIDKILNNNVPLYIQSTLYVGQDRNDNKKINDRVKFINDYLIEQCKKKSIQYVDVNKGLTENNILSPKYSYDGVHLNGDGYMIWKQIVSPYVKSIKK